MSVVLRGVVDPTTSADAAAPLLVLGPSLGTGDGGLAAPPRACSRDALPDRRGSTCPATGCRPPRPVRVTIGGSRGRRSSRSSTASAAARFVYAGVSLGGAIGIELASGPARATASSGSR